MPLCCRPPFDGGCCRWELWRSKNGFWDLHGDLKMNFGTFMAIQKWIEGPPQRSKNGLRDLHSDAKMDCRTFTAIQKWIAGPSRRSKNGLSNLQGPMRATIGLSGDSLGLSRAIRGYLGPPEGLESSGACLWLWYPVYANIGNQVFLMSASRR
jgi:hypothetical protein